MLPCVPQFINYLKTERALGGLLASVRFDTPTGPSIVVTAAVALVVSNLAGTLRR